MVLEKSFFLKNWLFSLMLLSVSYRNLTQEKWKWWVEKCKSSIWYLNLNVFLSIQDFDVICTFGCTNKFSTILSFILLHSSTNFIRESILEHWNRLVSFWFSFLHNFFWDNYTISVSNVQMRFVKLVEIMECQWMI